MTNDIYISENKEYETTYAIGKKVYKEKNCIVPTNQLEYDPGRNCFTYYCIHCCFGDCVPDNNDQQTAKIISTLP